MEFFSVNSIFYFLYNFILYPNSRMNKFSTPVGPVQSNATIDDKFLQDMYEGPFMDHGERKMDQATNEIDAHIHAAYDSFKQTFKLLLLGGPSSGKMTLLKQLRYLYVYKRGYPADDLRKYRDIVYENLIHILSTLASNCYKFGYENEEQNKESIAMLLSTDVKSALVGFDDNTDLKKCLLTVWSDKGIKNTFDNRHKFALMDNALYVLECMPRILATEYMPNFTDVSYITNATAGITKETYLFIYEDIKGSKHRYEIVDVKGQHTQRQKWIQYCDDVLAILFCIGLSGYDQCLWEDNTVNRFEEALNLLNRMCNENIYKSLRNAKFIIFLTERDLLREKIGKVAFKYKNEFGPSNDYHEIIEWIKNKIIKFDFNRTFYFNVTCVTDTEDIDR
eukprot:47385_1